MQTLDAVRTRALGGPVAAGPELALAATCLVGLFVEEVAARIVAALGQALALELIAIFWFPFLGGFVFIKAVRPWTRTLRVIAFLTVAALPTWQASTFGPRGVISLWTLTL